MIYTYNIGKLIKRLLGAKFRKGENNFFWLKSLLTPISTTNEKFLSYKEKVDLELNYTNQTISIQKMLNDKFDDDERRVQILHEENNADFIYYRVESQIPLNFYYRSESQTPEYLYERGENTSSIGGADFLIKIPSVLNVEETKSEMKANVNIYKLASKTFTIST